eukprot:3415497-Prymnesium_polylepis.1
MSFRDRWRLEPAASGRRPHVPARGDRVRDWYHPRRAAQRRGRTDSRVFGGRAAASRAAGAFSPQHEPGCAACHTFGST